MTCAHSSHLGLLVALWDTTRQRLSRHPAILTAQIYREFNQRRSKTHLTKHACTYQCKLRSQGLCTFVLSMRAIARLIGVPSPTPTRSLLSCIRGSVVAQLARKDLPRSLTTTPASHEAVCMHSLLTPSPAGPPHPLQLPQNMRCMLSPRARR